MVITLIILCTYKCSLYVMVESCSGCEKKKLKKINTCTKFFIEQLSTPYVLYGFYLRDKDLSGGWHYATVCPMIGKYSL